MNEPTSLRPQFRLLTLFWLTLSCGVVVHLFWVMRWEFAATYGLLAAVVLLDSYFLVTGSVTRWRVNRVIIAVAVLPIALLLAFLDHRGAKEIVFQPVVSRQTDRIASDLSKRIRKDDAYVNVTVNVYSFDGHRVVTVEGNVASEEKFSELGELVADAVPPGRSAWSVLCDELR